MDDQFNICLETDVAAVRAHFAKINSKYYLPSFFNIKKEAKILIEALIGGLHQYVPEIEFRFLVRNYFRDIIGIETPNMNGMMSPAETFAAGVFDTTFVPSTHVPGFQVGIQVGLQTAIVALYGPYFTNMDKARYVFYNGSSSMIPPYLPPVPQYLFYQLLDKFYGK